MSYNLKIIDIDTAYSQSDNKNFIDVEVEVLKDGELMGVKKFGYPLDTDEDFILADLKKVANALDLDLEIAIKSEEIEKSLKNVKEIKRSLVGLKINEDKKYDKKQEDRD